jgi:hypothetical protein
MEPFEQEPVIIMVESNTSPDQACEVFFQGNYHYCGDAGPGLVLCCPGGSQ